MAKISNVRKFDSLGIDSGIFISSNLVGPTNIWFDKTGTSDLIVNDYNANSIKRFDSAGNFLGTWASGNGLSQPEGVEFLPNGNVLIGSSGNGMVKMYDSLGNFISTIIDGSDTLNLMRPNAIRYRQVTINTISEKLEDKILILPNSGRIFKIKSEVQIKSIGLYDIQGRKIKNINIKNNTFYLSDVPVGLYYLRSLAEDRKINQKILVSD